MSENGVPNKKFAEQMRRHRKAWDDPSSAEYAIRKSYPGPDARAWVCSNTDCINHERPSHETYWLCEECFKVAPSVIDFYTHAPYKVLPPLKKRLAASASAFAVWCKNRPRSEKETTSPAAD